MSSRRPDAAAARASWRGWPRPAPGRSGPCRTRRRRRGSERCRHRPGKRRAKRSSRTARPEQEPDGKADGAADRDVLDPHKPHLPARRLEDVEHDQQRQRERGLTRGERNRRRRETGEQDSRWKEQPQQRRVCPDERHDRGADDESGGGPGQPAQRVLAGVQGIRAEHRQCAEDDPERVLDPGQFGDQHGQAKAGRAAHAVVKPDRVTLDVGGSTLLCRRQRPRQPWRPATDQSLEPATAFGRRGEVHVARDLGDDEAQLLRAEARVQRADELADPRVDGGAPGRRGRGDRQRQGVAALQLDERFAEVVERAAQCVGAPVRRIEQVRAPLQHRSSRDLDRTGRTVRRPPRSMTVRARGGSHSAS